MLADWRAQHRKPLVKIRTLLYRRMQSAGADGFVAQRLKRLPSVEAKLRRFETMKLSQMQDIGGCRIVVSSVSEVKDLHRRCRRGRQAHDVVGTTDYLAKPKNDGYRSVHLVYSYKSRSEKNRVWNGRKIEIQIRSRLQHTWATTVETVDVLQGIQLKTGGSGDGDWKRFFALMGTVHAAGERLPAVPGTPRKLAVVQSEVRELTDRLGALNVLDGSRAALRVAGHFSKESTRWVVLRLDAKRRRIGARPFSSFQKAQGAYLRFEEEHEGDPAFQVCLVSTVSAETMRREYPNYFLDVGLFLKSLRLFLESSLE